MALDEVFKALADPSRRRLLDRLNERNGQTLRELCVGLDMARQSVSKHLAVLEAAGLVTTLKRGREKLHYLNAAPINAIADRWIRQYSRERVRALADLKTALEAPMTETAADFVYTTFVYATPEQVWRGLTDPNFTRRYWGVELRSDWKIGSPVAWIERGVTLEDPEQVVLESDPYRRLAYVFPAFTRKYTDVSGFDDETAAKVVSEGSSHVAFDIEGLDDKVKLTVVHGGLAPGGAVQHLISGGWPVVLTNLKTFLEVDAVLPENLSTAH